jgi:hypothetical protein
MPTRSRCPPPDFTTGPYVEPWFERTTTDFDESPPLPIGQPRRAVYSQLNSFRTQNGELCQWIVRPVQKRKMLIQMLH